MIKKRGFTLIELLIVIGIIAILAAIIYVAVDPARRFAEARNTERWTASYSLLNAILTYASDNTGQLPGYLATAGVGINYVFGTGGIGGCPDDNCGAVNNSSVCIDLTSDLVDEYLSSIPKDSLTGTDFNTDYYVRKTLSGRIVVGACDPERGAVIYVSR
jgi:type IV pilus assembly protein PilA